jgi:hypothetical protein
MIAPAAIIAAVASGAVGTPVAQASGTGQVYQLTFSLNCDNKTSPLCAPDAFQLGGAWGEIKVDSDGTVSATVTFNTHNQGDNGALHQNLQGVAWSVIPASQLDGRFDTGTDPTGNYIVFDPASSIGFLAFPVTPDHYAASAGPGITAQSTVLLTH